MKKRSSNNLWLGIFVVVGLIIFVLAIYFIGNKQNLFGNTTKISSVFKNVNGLQLGNNVRYSGVNVGTVKAITIVSDTSICVDMIIDNKAVQLIKKNSLVTINTDGLVGSMILNILPEENGGSATVEEGDTLRSISKIATADMLTTLNTTNENAALLTADLLKITNSLNNGEGTLGALLKDETMAGDIKQSISNLQVMSRNALSTINKLNEIVSSLNYKESAVNVLLNDSLSARKITNIIESLDQSATEIKDISANITQFSNSLNTSDGTLNLILNDTSFSNHLNNTVRNIDESSIKFNENMEALKHNFLFRGYFRKLERQ
ncbi:MlaD family protein [Gillisia sp. M10.2A]|uniref:MlaD family protein n=1 Tax=Gillisia lutea TaxID=2909668 RepID=A0ABS9EK71_9FLAO|nr:MlaD family protein [Gillisia lutea]MCF4102727.1 MlaD family protein [Gillisia lutea]